METWRKAILETIKSVEDRSEILIRMCDESVNPQCIREYQERIDGMNFVLITLDKKLRKYDLT